ncbi:nucleotide-binding protein [Chelativorans intermedius]|uniref:GNVR domain-containing protein n=1 Tax=Chelativorans intermedius TaxID=515947 RepID=A0ABV6D693_9HYPH|nr:GNVR domain-containing protein [Chelativorans intermedius]MCT8999405.1 ATPase [Chelativorans intermedius]
MLERSRPRALESDIFPERGRDGEFISLSDILLFTRSNFLSIVLFALLGVLVAAFFIVTGDKIYTARTQILIEPKIPQLLQQQAAEVNLSLDTSQVETQLAVLRSEKIAMMVIDELNLAQHPGFRELSETTMIKRLQRLAALLVETFDLGGIDFLNALARGVDEDMSIAASAVASADDPAFEIRRRAIDAFGEGLAVNRVGVSYAIDIFFRSRDAALSARVANATAEAFMREQLETRTAAASEGLKWLQDRIDEVRAQMNEAVQIAQEFRARHDYRIGSRLDGAQEGVTGPTLEELEVTADTYRKMYESLLAAFTSSVDQKPYLIADARVITTATRPLGPSHPRKSLMLAFGLTAGLMAGIGLAFSRHLLDRTIRSPRQIRQELGTDCIGELPVVRFRRGGFGRLDEVSRCRHSAFATNLQSARAAIAVADGVQSVRLIGITSALPGDGKSTVAANLAALYAQSGLRTLLIDVDLNHCALTRELLRTSTGTSEAEDDEAGGGILRMEGRLYEFMPATAAKAHNLLSPKRLQEKLKELARYEMVVVDLPSFMSGVSAVEIASLLDGVVIVAEWRSTPLDLLVELTRTLRAVKAPLIGVLMTRVRLPSIRRQRRDSADLPR